MKQVTRLDAIKIFERATDQANLWENLMEDFYDETDDSFPTLYHVLIALGVEKEEYQQVTCADNIDWPEEVSEEDIYLHNMSVEENDVVMQLSGSALHILADAFIKQFKESGAVNFLEIAFQDRETDEPFLLTLQRQEGIRPTEKIAKLTKENDYLKWLAGVDFDSSKIEKIVSELPIGKFKICQMKMCAAIAEELSRQCPGITTEQAQMGAIIQAADLICDAVNKQGE
ncbi:hypothetical protein L5169_004796 [Vibrio parahaemolyticus]|nr:hypothetical protein [Vibrio parahaemolyticus]